MQTTAPEALKAMETEGGKIKAILDPLLEASKRFCNYAEEKLKSGDIQSAQVTMTYNLALHDIITYLFRLSDANLSRSAGEIRAEVAKTTQAIKQIRSWRR